MNELIYAFIVTHLSIMFGGLYFHRSIAHRSVIFHPVVAHIMRFWMWLTTGLITKKWIIIHRIHHKYTDKHGDPHSPVIKGLKSILIDSTLQAMFIGARQKNKNLDGFRAWGAGSPDDWIERNLYTPHNRLGVLLMLIINVALFGLPGLGIWIFQMVFLPFIGASVINGYCHTFGYRNHDTDDASRNLSPIGFFIGGEELHNNHHNDPGNPKFSYKPWEFDYGWLWISILIKLKLAKLPR